MMRLTRLVGLFILAATPAWAQVNAAEQKAEPAVPFTMTTTDTFELPWRIADFCPLHQNEIRGVLAGMTRVRKFEQDDAHIFCAPDQVEAEVEACLDFVRFVYDKVFQMPYVAKFSTRPPKFMGEPAVWDKAEADLKSALGKSGIAYHVAPGEAPSTGPRSTSS